MYPLFESPLWYDFGDVLSVIFEWMCIRVYTYGGYGIDNKGSRSHGSVLYRVTSPDTQVIRNQGMECCCFFFWVLWLASAIADRTDEAGLG